MIKNPKVGQRVFFLDDNDAIFTGKITQVFSGKLSVAIDNYWYVPKNYIFLTRKKAEKYSSLSQEWLELDAQIKKLQKQKEKNMSEIRKLVQ